MQSVDAIEYEVPFQRTVLFGSRLTPRHATRCALLLHGGGNSAADGFRELRAFLCVQGIETLAFDFVGHGRTGGSQHGTTLLERVQQVHEVVKSQRLERSTLTLVGFSMGAYVAMKVAVEAEIPRLCLAIPAAYAAGAYAAPFGPDFSQVLRTPRSWESSDAFGLARDYAGHLLVISAEEDTVIPAEIAHRYASGREHRASTVHHVIRGAGHKLNEHYEREPQARHAVYSAIASLCQRANA
ncbi:alpha/beta fold hydrolase [Uliginosibacterium sediminicola]|uniref:Alpha/beta fold hydrolase n=1 Tax=Uliginosibacterium sediminicola TaxID=2024550 RepID=A0ABU9YYF0_9RHOO